MKTKENTLNTLSRLTDNQLKAFEFMINHQVVLYKDKAYFIEFIDSDFKIALVNMDREVEININLTDLVFDY